MDEQVIQDWLDEYSALSPVELNSFASSIKHNNELIKALFLIFEEHRKFKDLIKPITKQLFDLYRSRETDLKLFTLQFLPSLIYIYLNSIAEGDKKSYHGVETLLIGIYNLEVVDDNGQPTEISFRLPSLAQASIYHEPMSLAHVSLTESALRRLEECNTKLIQWGPHPQVETINAQNRLKIITRLIFLYNRYIASLNKMSLKYLCKVSSSLATQGFGESISHNKVHNVEGSKVENPSRIQVSFQFLLELLSGLYYAMYNDFGHLAIQAIEDIYNRGCYECYANVIAVANAIKNSSKSISTDTATEGPMGINLAFSPTPSTVTTVNKFMITNASFRTKKLPDDIPIIQKEESSGGGGGGGDTSKPLTSIAEEKEDGALSVKISSLRGKDAVTKNLQKLGIGKKSKDKDGKSSSKTNLVGAVFSERRQSATLHLTNLKDKVLLKSPANNIYNGDSGSAETDQNSHSSGKKKIDFSGKEIANGPLSGEGHYNKSNSVRENQSGLTSEDLNSTAFGEEVCPLTETSKPTEEKTTFMQVSSV